MPSHFTYLSETVGIEKKNHCKGNTSSSGRHRPLYSFSSTIHFLILLELMLKLTGKAYAVHSVLRFESAIKSSGALPDLSFSLILDRFRSFSLPVLVLVVLVSFLSLLAICSSGCFFRLHRYLASEFLSYLGKGLKMWTSFNINSIFDIRMRVFLFYYHFSIYVKIGEFICNEIDLKYTWEVIQINEIHLPVTLAIFRSALNMLLSPKGCRTSQKINKQK